MESAEYATSRLAFIRSVSSAPICTINVRLRSFLAKTESVERETDVSPVKLPKKVIALAENSSGSTTSSKVNVIIVLLRSKVKLVNTGADTSSINVATESLSVVKNVASSVSGATWLPAISVTSNMSYLIQQVCLLLLPVQRVSLSNLIAFKSFGVSCMVTEGPSLDMTSPPVRTTVA